MSPTQTDTIEIEIEIAARPSTVYKFLSVAERFCEWLLANDGWRDLDEACVPFHPE